MSRMGAGLNGGRERRHLPGRWRLVGIAVGVGALVGTLPAFANGPTMITSCSQSAVEAGISQGGTVEFAQNCEVELSSTLSLKNLNVDLQANGHTVVLNGEDAVRIMSISGGNVTIGGIDFFHGEVAGTPGAAGAAPRPGTAGGSAIGGALLISSGTVALDDDNFELDSVHGGTVNSCTFSNNSAGSKKYSAEWPNA